MCDLNHQGEDFCTFQDAGSQALIAMHPNRKRAGPFGLVIFFRSEYLVVPTTFLLRWSVKQLAMFNVRLKISHLLSRHSRFRDSVSPPQHAASRPSHVACVA